MDPNAVALFRDLGIPGGGMVALLWLLVRAGKWLGKVMFEASEDDRPESGGYVTQFVNAHLRLIASTERSVLRQADANEKQAEMWTKNTSILETLLAEAQRHAGDTATRQEFAELQSELHELKGEIKEVPKLRQKVSDLESSLSGMG